MSKLQLGSFQTACQLITLLFGLSYHILYCKILSKHKAMPLPTALFALVTYVICLLSDAVTHLWQLGRVSRLHFSSSLSWIPRTNGNSLGSFLQQPLPHRETGQQEPSY